MIKFIIGTLLGFLFAFLFIVLCDVSDIWTKSIIGMLSGLTGAFLIDHWSAMHD